MGWVAFVVCVKLFLGEDVGSCIFKKIDQILNHNMIYLCLLSLFLVFQSVCEGKNISDSYCTGEEAYGGGGFVNVALFNSIHRTAATRSGGIYYVRKIAMY